MHSSMRRGEWEGDQGRDSPAPQLCVLHYGFFWAYLCTPYLIALFITGRLWDYLDKKNKRRKVIRSADTRSNLGFKTVTTSRLLNKPISNFFKAKAVFSRASRSWKALNLPGFLGLHSEQRAKFQFSGLKIRSQVIISSSYICSDKRIKLSTLQIPVNSQ